MTDDRVPRTAGDASRRAVVGGLIGLGIGVPLLAACGSGSDSEDSGSTASGTVGKASEVPVGGAKIYAAEQVMVSQPAKGDFKAFSTICTHEKCIITELKGDEIECGCHHSRFATSDGSVTHGPASRPLQELKVTVKGDDLSVSS